MSNSSAYETLNFLRDVMLVANNLYAPIITRRTKELYDDMCEKSQRHLHNRDNDDA